MKICFIRTDYAFNLKFGGSVTHISGFVKGLKELGHQIFLVSTDKLLGVNEKTYKVSPPLLLRVPISLFRVLFNYFFINKVLKIIENEKPDCIYQRHTIFNFCGARLSARTGIPLILEVNSSEVWAEKHWGGLRFEKIATIIENMCFKSACRIMVVSKYVKKQLVDLGVDEQKIRINPNGVDPGQFYPEIRGEQIRRKYTLENKIVVGFVGTFSYYHGTSVLARAIKTAVTSNPDIHFLNIGKGVLHAEFDRIIREDAVSEHVVNIDMVPHTEIQNYLAACDILVSPQLQNEDGTEFFGSPTKLFEYMGMGKAIIASRVGQIKEILKDGENGILVDPGNHIQLAEAIIRAAGDKELRKSLGKEANKSVLANYTWKHNAIRVIDAYQELKKDPALK